ncbi:E3 ubiquitin-protein ligase UBR3 [Acromyrmex echinatior]|uniref:E3 ubiquitin-protein ligase n=1 Tax=Acromyrmex echinatior TaxID=103372 RepID=F4WEJ6_ACREC|nr:E3 ubiquitin-protein ligase UBR3 [Acromyrmex echinatior]
MTYIQCNFCNSMVDADLYLLQICATKLMPDVFLKTVIEKFHVLEWMSLCLYHAPQNEYLEGEHDTPMLESCLTFLATLVNVRTNLGLSDPEMSRLEMVTLLCMSDKTHSQLMELMPERCGTTQNRDFESVLADVAQYRAPNLEASGNMQQGMYGPKGRVWEDVKQSGKLKNNATLWPPFRQPAPVSSDYDDPRIVLRSRVFHAMILIILYKAVNGRNISEHVMALAIYLLEMAVITAEPPDKSGSPLCQYTGGSFHVIKDMDLAGWYESDSLSENLRTTIPQVILVQESEHSSSDSEFEWEMIHGEMSEVATSLMLNDGADDGAEEVSLELLGFSVDTVRDDNGVSNASASSLPALLPSVESAASLPALPSTSVEYGVAIVPEDGIVAIPARSNSEDDLTIPLQRALPPSEEESMAIHLAIESPPSPNNEIGGQPALPPVPQRPAVLAGNEIVTAQPINYRATEIVPSTSNSYKHFKRRELQGGPMQPQSVKVGESIISLLLKLHSQLSGVPDSYNPEQSAMSDNEVSSSSSSSSSISSSSSSSSFISLLPSESRIGDGPFFISQLLRKIADLDPICKQTIIETRNKLWPRMQECEEDEQREKENREREERRKRAKERQQKLMAEFANKQKQFMEKAMETEDADASGMDWDQEENETKLTSKKEYDCVICNQTTPSSEDKPMGLVVLVQATSIIGHERQQSDRLVLPTSDEDPPIPKGDTRGAHFDRRMDEMNRLFDTLSWLLSVNIGWEGGVHVQTCGHHLHLDCLKSYLESLRSQQRQQSLAVERGEYLCPLCRQLANSVLPLSPQLGECSAVVRSRHASTATILADLNTFLKEIQRNPVSSNLSVAMGKAMEDMTSCTYLKYKQKNCKPSHQSLFLFVTSVARTNFEIELVQRGGSLCVAPPTTIPLMPKRDCIVALLHVLAMHARVLTTWPVHHVWQQLSGISLMEESTSSLALTPHERQVPLLLRDPTAMLIQFILLLPLHLDQTYFSGVVKVLYNLLYYQVILQVSCNFSREERNMILKKRCSCATTPSETILAEIIEYFSESGLYPGTDDNKPSTSTSPTYARVKSHCIEQQIQSLCLPFLRVAALLRYHLYEQPLQFVRLVYYLELVTEGMSWDSFDSTVALNWQEPEAGVSVPLFWCDQLIAFLANWRGHQPARNLIMEQHISWHVPKLVSLPREYEKIFTYYHERQCSMCHSVPPEISICLLCGTIVCLKQNCCRQMNVFEATQHSIDCGGGTGIYLVVTSTYIIVIRGRRACLWGSLYLDDFEEEDRDLKRGKPLYLSQDRYQLLEQQWLAHRFDHTKRTWVWHRDAL